MRNYQICKSTFGATFVLLLCQSIASAQTGVSRLLTLDAIGAFSFPRNGPEDNNFGFQLNASQIHHITKNIGFEYGLSYSLLQTKHSERQIDIRSHKRYALSHLRYQSAAIPINVRYYFNKTFNIYVGLQTDYAFSDVTKVFSVRYRYDEVMNDSHITLLSTTNGENSNRFLNAYQIGVSYNLDLNKYYWQFGLGYARFAQSFKYTYYTQDYSFRISRFTMRIGFWFTD